MNNFKFTIIICIAISFIILNGCEPEWKKNINALEEKLMELEGLYPQILNGNMEAIVYARALIDDITKLEINISGIKASDEINVLVEKYKNAIILTGEIAKYEEMLKN